MENKILFFTSYPRKGQIHDKKIVGGASYTKTLLSYLGKKVIVYAERFNSHEERYSEGTTLVKRNWRRNDPISIIWSVIQASRERINTFVVSYEVNMLGGPVMSMIFLLSLLLVKIKGIKIVFIPHQVVEDFNHIEENKLKATVLNLMKTVLFSYINLISDRIIVFEEQLKKVLPEPKKVTAIPIAVEQLEIPDQRLARKKLNIPQNEFVILFFGFLSPYKGVEDILKKYDRKDGLLIIAGDGNPNHMNKQWYKEYVRDIKLQAREKGALTPGFIPEEEIKYYYAAADVLVLPYRIFFSSSFPLSLAASYEKPFLLSKKLEAYFAGLEFKEALKKSGLTREHFVVDFKHDLKNALNRVKLQKNKYIEFSKEIKEKRSWSEIASRIGEAISV
jgi:glycosyltransferase involved in cell wall biosynthesis